MKTLFIVSLLSTLLVAGEPKIPYYDPFVNLEPQIGEKLWPKEKDYALEVIDLTTHFIQRRYDEGRRPAMRDAHAKAHGCLQGNFTTRKNIPPSLRHGIFSNPLSSFKALIRYSNGNSELRADSKRDGRGMAIKLLEVDGAKLVSDFPEKMSQDFVMLNFPTFFIDNPEHYIKTIRIFHSGKFNENVAGVAALLFGGLKGEERKVALKHQTRVHNPLKEVYWSETPYRLGVTGSGASLQAIKYAALPVSCTKPEIPIEHKAQLSWIESTRKKNRKNISKETKSEHDYLRSEMAKSIQQDDMCYVFAVQPFVSLEKTPIEITTKNWDESSAWIPVADLTIQKGQSFISDAELEKCENLSFTSWHTLPAHKPLGAVNRARLMVYSAVAKYRRDLNRVSAEEREDPKPSP